MVVYELEKLFPIALLLHSLHAGVSLADNDIAGIGMVWQDVRQSADRVLEAFAPGHQSESGHHLAAREPEALFGLLFPSLVLMMILGIAFMRFKDMPFAQAMLTAVRPVVVALLAYTVYTVFPKSIKNWHTGLIGLAAFAAVAFLNVHPALTILAAAILGLVVYR